jgi:Flp pilus assembly pilin Flp
MPTTTSRSDLPADDDRTGPAGGPAPCDASGTQVRLLDDQDGSMVSEYGLVAVLGATIVGIAISWAKGGAITALLAAVLRQVRAVIGA